MLVRTPARDDHGSALVSVVVMMLVLTIFTMTLAAMVTNTASSLTRTRAAAQARAAADEGLATALAAFQKTKSEDYCPSISSPTYWVDCTLGAHTVTLTSKGRADSGAEITVQAVYSFANAQSYEPKVGQLTFFSTAAMNQPNVLKSSTADPASVTIVAGGFTCSSPMSANLVVEGNFTASYGCAVSGWVKTKGNATLHAGSSIGKDLTTVGSATLRSESSIGGGVVAGANVTVEANSKVAKDVVSGGWVSLASGSSVGGNVSCAGYANLKPGGARVTGNLQTGGYAKLESGSWVGGHVTSSGDADVDGTVDGDLLAGGDVVTRDNSKVAGSVTAVGSDRTSIDGEVGKDVRAAGPVTIEYGSIVGGDLIAAGTSASNVFGTVRGDVAVGGAVTVVGGGKVLGSITAAGSDNTSVWGSVGGTVTVAGTLSIEWGATVAGAATAAGTGTTAVKGRLQESLQVAGTVTVSHNASIGGDLSSSGSGTDTIEGTITGDVHAGGDVEMYSGSVGGHLTLPDKKNLIPKEAKKRVGGNVSSKPAPAPPSAPAAPSLNLVVPTVKVAPPVEPDLPLWQDYGYSSADWPGFSPQVLGKSDPLCGKRDWATHLESLTSPTIVDATACNGGLSVHPTSTTTVTIKTDVVVVSSEIDLEFVTFRPDAGASPRLWFIVPSAARSVKPYPGVSAGSGRIDLSSTNVSVPTMLYTPGRIGSRMSTFTGSMYASGAEFDSAPPGDIKAAPVAFPIPLFDAAPSTTPGGVFSVTRISQRELP